MLSLRLRIHRTAEYLPLGVGDDEQGESQEKSPGLPRHSHQTAAGVAEKLNYLFHLEVDLVSRYGIVKLLAAPCRGGTQIRCK